MQRPVFIILPITPLLRSPLHSASNNRDEIQATAKKHLTDLIQVMHFMLEIQLNFGFYSICC